MSVLSVESVNRQALQQEIASSRVPLLIDFWAPWCGPCRMFAPTIDRVAASQAGRVKVLKVNIGEEPELAQQFGVMSIPTLVLLKEGAVAARSVGVQPEQAVLRMLEN